MLQYTRLGRTVQILFITIKQHSVVSNHSLKQDFPSNELILSEQNRNECIKKMKYMKVPERELTEENKKRAAVLIPLCQVNDELSLLYTLRKADLKRHRGQVSFPGGMEDTTDMSLEFTALRETEEELGIRKNDIHLWGSSWIYVGKEFSVLPVVGYLGQVDIQKLNPNPDEVEVVFTLPLKHFCDPKNCRSTQFRYRGQSYIMPAYINDEYRVWGLTALITHMFLLSLLPNNYKHKLNFIKSVVSMKR
ncbi:mitochondrial coenzyme A diphosphatase NUDT8 [Rhodnius prolixus]